MVLLVRMEDRRLRQLLLEWVGLLLLPLLFYAPSFFLGIGSIMTLWKIALQLAWVTLFANSMSLQNIIDVLIWFRLPRVLIFQIETTFKYIYLLAVQLSKQLDTLSLRLTGAQTPMKVGIHLIGTLFLKTLDYMTDLGHAMVLRGSGPVYRRPKLPLQKIDWGCLCLCVLAACFFIFWS